MGKLMSLMAIGLVAVLPHVVARRAASRVEVIRQGDCGAQSAGS